MKYQGQPGFSHRYQPKVGVIVTNLGTPDEATTPALRRYLAEFLSDPRVVEFPRLLWKCILHGIILRIRPRRSAAAYQTVWTEAGSPLLIHTRNQAQALDVKLKEEYGENIIVDFAMRYGSHAIGDCIQKFQAAGVNKLLVLPLYPQYSGATTGSTFDALAKDFTQRRCLPDLRFISHYHDHPQYIAALANSVTRHWQQYGRADRLIFSYHGVPLRYLHNGDPYHCECHKTSRLVAEHLGLNKEDYLTTFQSRFGREEWLKPYTDETLKSLPQQGIESVQIICPGFSADCLETIEEIGEENRDYFVAAGGKRYEYIPALNDSPEHIVFLHQLIKQHLQGWEINGNDNREKTQQLFQTLKEKNVVSQ